ncbi:hypothetical protein K440DRAFT_664210 [Wilcoxina mikolae CBS 423.85]|nr:hypothetical protein K440DRAFT_664210 [Wilcoxina mikolae CBS 423.85]
MWPSSPEGIDNKSTHHSLHPRVALVSRGNRHKSIKSRNLEQALKKRTKRNNGGIPPHLDRHQEVVYLGVTSQRSRLTRKPDHRGVRRNRSNRNAFQCKLAKSYFDVREFDHRQKDDKREDLKKSKLHDGGEEVEKKGPSPSSSSNLPEKLKEDSKKDDKKKDLKKGEIQGGGERGGELPSSSSSSHRTPPQSNYNLPENLDEDDKREDLKKCKLKDGGCTTLSWNSKMKFIHPYFVMSPSSSKSTSKSNSEGN